MIYPLFKSTLCNEEVLILFSEMGLLERPEHTFSLLIRSPHLCCKSSPVLSLLYLITGWREAHSVSIEGPIGKKMHKLRYSIDRNEKFYHKNMFKTATNSQFGCILSFFCLLVVKEMFTH